MPISVFSAKPFEGQIGTRKRLGYPNLPYPSRPPFLAVVAWLILLPGLFLGAGIDGQGWTPHFVVSAAHADVNYIYDETGQLTGMVDASGNAAEYVYDDTGNLQSIVRKASNQVAIFGFTPGTGPEGTAVTIGGTGFSATAVQNTIRFNGTAAAVASASTTSLVTAVPVGAITGFISVTAPNGTATSSRAFTVTPKAVPTITSFSPTSGLSGSAVTVSGSHFETVPQNNKAAFNGQVALVTSASATTLGLTVPPTATSGHISVTTPNGKAVSTGDFIVPPSPWTTADIEYTGRMTIGSTQTATITTAGKKALILFDGTAGQRVSLVMSNSALDKTFTKVRILNLDGTTLASGYPFQSLIEPTVLPATGSYTIIIEPYQNNTGSITLALYDVPPDPTGTIAADGSPVTVTTTAPGQNASLTFSGTAGQRISLKMSNSTIYATSPVIIKSPDGSTLASSSPTLGFIDTKVLPATGTYTIAIDPWGATAGSLTLTMYDVPPDPTGSITPGGSPVTVTTTVPGQNASLTFSGSAGQRVSLKMANSTLHISSTVTINNPDGSKLVSGYTFNGYIDVKTLPTSGTYTIVIDPWGSGAGSVTLTLYDIPPDPTGSITAGGSPVTVTTTVPGQNASLTFSGSAGQRISLKITNSTLHISSTVTINNPDGSKLVSGYTFDGYIDVKTLPTSGTYTIVIDPWGSGAGSVTLTLYNVPADATGSISIGGSSITLTTGTPGQNALLTFAGTAGQNVTVKLSGNTMGYVTVTVKKTDGSSLTSLSSVSASFNLTSQILPTTGSYSIAIDPYKANTGSITTTLTSP